MGLDPPLPRVFTRAVALDAGLSRNQVTQRLGNGRWRRLVHGAFTVTSSWEQASAEERHVLLARAVLMTRDHPDGQVFSHVSAAVLHALPVSLSALGTVWMTVGPSEGRSTRYGPLRREVAHLRSQDVTRRDDLPVTALARTVADCLRHLPLEDCVPLADAALRSGLVSSQEIAAVLTWQAGWPYARAAARAERLVDGRRESVLESRSAIVIDAHGLPTPTPQAVIRDRHGNFVARPDFVWERHGVVGEADGATKYRTGDPVQVIRAEKDRQSRLEALGLVVVRWDWRHLVGDPPELVLRLRRALATGDPRRFRGHVA